ncbi:MAG: hypothetical protein ACI89X_000190 [Planctomycetota bacterium]|jgi:hypothetical protein
MLALTACASSPVTRDPGDDALRRFDELCQFLPPGMSSYWFSDWVSELPTERAEGESILIARAASDFRSLPGIPGMGKESSVDVHDFSKGLYGGLEERTDDWIIEPPIAGHPVRRTKATGEEQVYWIAFVDKRFQVSATSRPLLVRALARSGTRQSLLAFMPDLSVLDAKTTDLIFCRPRPQPTTMFGAPSPTSTLMVQVHATEPRIEIFATERQRAIEDYFGRDGYLKGRHTELSETLQHGSYHVFDLTYAKRYWALELHLLYGQYLAI